MTVTLTATTASIAPTPTDKNLTGILSDILEKKREFVETGIKMDVYLNQNQQFIFTL